MLLPTQHTAIKYTATCCLFEANTQLLQNNQKPVLKASCRYSGAKNIYTKLMKRAELMRLAHHAPLAIAPEVAGCNNSCKPTCSMQTRDQALCDSAIECRLQFCLVQPDKQVLTWEATGTNSAIVVSGTEFQARRGLLQGHRSSRSGWYEQTENVREGAGKSHKIRLRVGTSELQTSVLQHCFFEPAWKLPTFTIGNSSTVC